MKLKIIITYNEDNILQISCCVYSMGLINKNIHNILYLGVLNFMALLIYGHENEYELTSF